MFSRSAWEQRRCQIELRARDLAPEPARLPSTHVAQGAEIYELMDLVLHEPLVDTDEKRHLQGTAASSCIARAQQTSYITQAQQQGKAVSFPPPVWKPLRYLVLWLAAKFLLSLGLKRCEFKSRTRSYVGEQC